MLLTSIIVQVKSRSTPEASLIIAIQAMRRTGIAQLSGMIGIETKRTDHQTFILDLEESTHTAGAVISSVVAVQTSSVTFLALKGRREVSLRTCHHALSTTVCPICHQFVW